MKSKAEEETVYQEFMNTQVFDEKNLVPADFSDSWLTFLGEELNRGGGLISIALIMLLIGIERKTNELSISDEELANYCSLYRLEISMERLRRRGKISSEAATRNDIYDETRINKIKVHYPTEGFNFLKTTIPTA